MAQLSILLMAGLSVVILLLAARLTRPIEHLTLVNAVTVDIAGGPCWLFIVRDITEHKVAQEAPRVSDERLQQAVRVTDMGIFDHDHRSGVIY